MLNERKRLSSLQPNLENELVTLRHLKKNDFEDLYQVAKDPEIWKQHPVPNRYQKEEFSIFFKEALASKSTLIIIDKKSQNVIGSTRFKKLKSVHSAIEIGWTFLARAYWGGVYNRAIKTLMIDYAFSFFDDIIFYVSKSNLRSQRAVEKIGGVLTGERIFQSASVGNDLTYRISKNEWMKLTK
jgi:RimJ/RimL family protein N-acetyltransferase